MPKLLFSPEAHPDLTYSDVFLVPNNPIVERARAVATGEEFQRLLDLHKASREARRDSLKAMRKAGGVGHPKAQRAAFAAHKAFRDYVFELATRYPDIGKVISRDDVDIHPADGFGNIPIVIANMNQVVGKRMAEILAQMGGSAAVPQDKEDPEMLEIGEYMHSRDTRYLTPITVSRKTKVHELKTLLEKRDQDTAIVLDDDGKFYGIVQMQDGSDIKKGMVPNGINVDAPIDQYVRTKGDIATANEQTSDIESVRLMNDRNVDFLPVVDDDGTVKGTVTRKFLGMRWRYHPHVDPEHGGYAMLATVGALNKNPIDRTKFLLDIGVRGIVFDTAHFDQGLETYRNVEQAASIIQQRTKQKVHLIAGNVVTRQATRDMIVAGVDIVKVGLGPGAMCETRMETGVGRPQFSAVYQCAQEAEIYGRKVWADGGIQYPRDVALALAAGASQVMIGSLFTPTVESPPLFKEDEQGEYKINRGMASRQEAMLRTLGRLEQDMRAVFRSVVGQRSEGLSEAKVYVKDGKESAADLVHWIMDGITSAATYLGARSVREMPRFARIGVQTRSGYDEGKPKQIS